MNLTEEEVKSMVTPIGIAKKIVRLIKKVRAQLSYEMPLLHPRQAKALQWCVGFLYAYSYIH